MKKTKLISLIEKYALQGSIESVIWNTSANNTTVELAHPNKTLIGTVTLKNSEIEDSNMGIFDTSKLTQMVNVLDSEFEFNIQKNGNSCAAIELKDKSFNMKFVPSSTDVIPKAANLKQLPPFEIKFKVDKEFISKYIKATKAVTAEVTAFKSDGSKIEINVGYSDTVNTNNVKFNIIPEICIDSISAFHTEYLKNVLVANQDAEGTIEISSKGLMKLTFENENFNSVYYLVQTNLN